MLAACLTLATTGVLQQVVPQRVEQRTEYRWCVEPERAWLERRSRMVIDGRAVGDLRTDRVLTLEEQQSLPDLSGGNQ